MKIKAFYFIVFFVSGILLSGVSIAQKTEKNFTKGIYMEFEDFKNNKPSFTDSFFVEKSSGFMKVMFGSSSAHLTKVDASGKKEKIKNAWGYCNDNDQLFINYDGDFNQIHNYGVYCVFDTDVKARKPGYYYLSSMYIPNSGYYYKILYVLNLRNGKIIRLNRENMLDILLIDDSALHDKFQDMDNNQDNLIRFIELYNAKHAVK